MLTRAPEGLPLIVQTAEQLLVNIEEAVRGFPCYHKYTLGSDLRRQAMTTVYLVHRAWCDKAQVDEHLQRLIWEVDELKLSLQLGRQINTFASFAQFETCAKLAVKYAPSRRICSRFFSRSIGCQGFGTRRSCHAAGHSGGKDRPARAGARLAFGSAQKMPQP